MTGARALHALAGAAAGGVLATVIASRLLRNPGERLVRTNVDGRRVPAVLGMALVVGGALGNLVVAIAWLAIPSVQVGPTRTTRAFIAVVLVLLVAGAEDDLRGDEEERGFRGHLAAARRGHLTGGLVKIVAGGVAGLLAGVFVREGWAILEVAALVALTANLMNLLDRAPGRAAKAGLLIGLPLAVLGSAAWTIEAAGVLGALGACLPFDLRARAMLGDAGSNPLGGVLGLGFAVSLDRPGRLVAIALLVLLNALSERFSFSRAIEATPLLRWFDMLGRK